MNKILLFIPMYNCEKQIIRGLKSLTPEVVQYISEIIIVNNRSTDNGESAVVEFCKENKNFSIKVFRNVENYGLGGSHKVAFQYAIDNNFDYLIVLHGDDQSDISDLEHILANKVYKHYDMCLGARFMRGSKLYGYSKFRTFGNIIYNGLFSIVTGNKIYDLGSGLNIYDVNVLKDKFYYKYKDDLLFNYCMILGSSYYKHNFKFFPISWKETDQVSNVKLLNQAITVLRLLFGYFCSKEKFVNVEHRDKIYKNYETELVYSGYSADETFA